MNSMNGYMNYVIGLSVGTAIASSSGKDLTPEETKIVLLVLGGVVILVILFILWIEFDWRWKIADLWGDVWQKIKRRK